MRRREYYWSLYHRPVKNQLDELKTDQVEAIFAAIPPTQRSEWLIWKEGLASWKDFEEFPLLLKSLREIQIVVEKPPVPFAETEAVGAAAESAETPAATQTHLRPAATSAAMASSPSRPTDSLGEASANRPRTHFQINESVSDVDLSLMRDGASEDRDNVRYRKRFEVKIFANDNIYLNSTIDISMKGLLLRDPVPQGLPRYFNVELSSGEQTVTLICSEVRGAKGQSSGRLQIEVNDYGRLLQTMLLAG